ncbi:uncharacterized protein C20orf85 homolog [Schistocerca nitens]|uniref:uncharacterized protein C20orf85 homolog n=1 Tax=Schistocerca nitens TaxID=7011 RepID=UPI002117E0F0|nr:uncharacterized protein C20orf85 homolog [Schistocerca nitens]
MSATGKKDEKANGTQPVKMQQTNLVKMDGMLREALCTQEKANKTWEKKWGFMTQYRKFLEEEAKSRGISLEAISKGSKKQEITTGTAFTVPSSPPIPLTSSGFIGWRSSLQSCSLEKVGPFYISPVHTIEPPDLPKQKPQLTIFIG